MFGRNVLEAVHDPNELSLTRVDMASPALHELIGGVRVFVDAFERLSLGEIRAYQ